MPVTLRCRCKHTFDMPTARWHRDGARCPVCGAIVVTKVKPSVPKMTPHPMMSMQEGETCAEAKAKAQAATEEQEIMLDAAESPRLCDLYPIDNDLDDPDSPRHQVAM